MYKYTSYDTNCNGFSSLSHFFRVELGNPSLDFGMCVETWQGRSSNPARKEEQLLDLPQINYGGKTRTQPPLFEKPCGRLYTFGIGPSHDDPSTMA